MGRGPGPPQRASCPGCQGHSTNRRQARPRAAPVGRLLPRAPLLPRFAAKKSNLPLGCINQAGNEWRLCGAAAWRERERRRPGADPSNRAIFQAQLPSPSIGAPPARPPSPPPPPPIREKQHALSSEPHCSGQKKKRVQQMAGVTKAACCGQTNYLSNYDLPLNHMIFLQSCGQLKPG